MRAADQPAASPSAGDEGTESGGQSTGGEADRLRFAQRAPRGGRGSGAAARFPEAEPAQLFRYDVARGRADAAIREVQQIDPNWRPTPSLSPPRTIERAIRDEEEMLREAQERITMLRAGAPGEPSAFHYTFEKLVSDIEREGLKPGTYATTIGTLSPMQAHIDLALRPNRGLPGVVIRIDLAALQRAGYRICRAT
jgi:hypothetical protein